MNKFFPTLITFIGIFSSTIATADQDNRPEVRLCATLPVTGNIAFFGTGVQNSVQLALEELGATKYHYTLTVEDDQASPAKAVSAFKKLTVIDKCLSVFSASSNVGLAIAPLAVKADVIHLGISSDSSFADGKHNFDIWPAPNVPVSKLIEQFRIRKISKVALFGLEHAWPHAVFEALVPALQKENIQVTMYDYFQPGETNFRPLLEKFRRSGSEIGILLSWSPELEIFGRQYRELGIPIPLTSEFAFESAQEPSLFEGFWFVTLNTSTEEYKNRFFNKFKYAPYAQMELGDVMTRLVVDAIEEIGDGNTVPSVGAISQQLLTVKNKPSVFGPIDIRPDGILNAPYVVKHVTNGKFIQGQ